MSRWHVLKRSRLFNIYYHQMHESDDDRALHDHRAHNISIVLSGGYLEHIKGKRLWRRPGSIIFRRGSTPHRIELPKKYGVEQQSTSLFIKFPDYREWGFHCRKGWVPADEFCRTVDGVSKETRGCD